MTPFEDPAVTIALSLIAVVIATALLILYYYQKISIVEIVVYGFATQTYTVEIVGPSISTLFLVSFFFLFDEIVRLTRKPLGFSAPTLILLLVPAISSVAILLIYNVYPDIFEIKSSELRLLIQPFYFYVKQFLPLIAIAAKVYRYAPTMEADHFYKTIKRTATCSGAVALVQYLIHYAVADQFIDQMIGLKLRYSIDYAGLGNFIRVQGLCLEPKHFSALLALALPIYLRDRNYCLAGLNIALGILCLSNTYTVLLGIAVLAFWATRGLRSLRVVVIVGIIAIVSAFSALSSISENIIQEGADAQDNVAYLLLASRAVDRYSFSQNAQGENKSNELMGMPLQYDLEAPIVNYFKDHPMLLFFGYGPANNLFLPAKYWEGVYSYEDRLTANKPTNMNMRWLYYSFEFGVPGFLIYLWYLTRWKDKDRWNRQYFAFLLLGAFFIEIDVFVIIAYALHHGRHRYFPTLNANYTTKHRLQSNRDKLAYMANNFNGMLPKP